jgi:hypothetical protein
MLLLAALILGAVALKRALLSLALVALEYILKRNNRL